jgi:hypothetical protein
MCSLYEVRSCRRWNKTEAAPPQPLGRKRGTLALIDKIAGANPCPAARIFHRTPATRTISLGAAHLPAAAVQGARAPPSIT